MNMKQGRAAVDKREVLFQKVHFKKAVLALWETHDERVTLGEHLHQDQVKSRLQNTHFELFHSWYCWIRGENLTQLKPTVKL